MGGDPEAAALCARTCAATRAIRSPGSPLTGTATSIGLTVLPRADPLPGRRPAGQIIKTGHVTDSHRAALGVRVQTVTGPDCQPAGAGIAAVTPGGPAAR